MRELAANALRGVLTLDLRDVLFVHWPVDPGAVAPSLPRGLTVDALDGDAWVSAVAFRVARLGPRGVPVGRSFGQVNLRTYVEPAGGDRLDPPRAAADRHQGVYFYSLDADDPIGAAATRWLLHLRYRRADVSFERRAEGVRVRSQRTERGEPPARFAATYRPTGDPFDAPTDERGRFLAERYRMYAVDERGRRYAGDVRHDPWRLYPATADVAENTLFDAAGLPRPSRDPLVHYCPRKEMVLGRVARADGRRARAPGR